MCVCGKMTLLSKISKFVVTVELHEFRENSALPHVKLNVRFPNISIACTTITIIYNKNHVPCFKRWSTSNYQSYTLVCGFWFEHNFIAFFPSKTVKTINKHLHCNHFSTGFEMCCIMKFTFPSKMNSPSHLLSKKRKKKFLIVSTISHVKLLTIAWSYDDFLNFITELKRIYFQNRHIDDSWALVRFK